MLASRIEEADRRYAAMLAPESRPQAVFRAAIMASIAVAALVVTRRRRG